MGKDGGMAADIGGKKKHIGNATLMSASSANPEDELDNLKRRFALLEGDRKAYYENSQWTIKSNRDEVAALRAANKDLRQRISKVTKGDMRGSDDPASYSNDPIGKLEYKVNNLRKRSDELSSVITSKEDELEQLEDKLHDLEKEEQSLKRSEEESPHMTRIRSLENRLEKALIKYNEAQSIRKTYESIQQRLQEERLTYDNQLAMLEAAIRAKAKELEALQVVSRDAQHAKEVTRFELHNFEAFLSEERKARERELKERKEMVRSVLESTEKMEKRQQRMQVLEGEEEGAAGSAVKQPDEEQEKKLTTYEEAFRKIKEATGISEVTEVLDKFSTQGDTQMHLAKLQEDNEVAIVRLTEEKSALQAQLNELKYSGEVQSGGRQLVDELDKRVRDSTERRDKKGESVLRVSRVIVNAKSGVQHLANKIGQVEGEQAMPTVTEDNMGDALALIETRLIKILAKIDEKEGQMQIDPARHPPPAIAMPEHNVRIKLPDRLLETTGATAELLFSSSDDDAVGEDELQDRDAMKKQAFQIVHHHQDKRRKGKKPKRQPGGGAPPAKAPAK
eukprot:Opistho-2@46201